MSSIVFRHGGHEVPRALLRQNDNFGMPEYDLAAPPHRFWDDASHGAPPLIDMGVDARHAKPVAGPAELIARLPVGDNWTAMTSRSLARLAAWFLICEDPQGRLRAQPVATLAHQASLVSHVLGQPNLARVLLADEVGLGKTVEAGLIIKGLIDAQPGLRVLYLAPARLVANVRREFDRLGLPFRQWVAGEDRDAQLTDPRIIASIHRAVHETNFQKIIDTPPWDVIVVDECHHLSDWEAGGGKPVKQYRLASELIALQKPSSRVILMSGTPHQGHAHRFENLLKLLRRDGEDDGALAGRVVYRTKDDVRDWRGAPLFPARQVNDPLIIDLGPEHRRWLSNIHDFYVPPLDQQSAGRRRAAGWRCAQALQWATSSVQAGLGYLVRQALRAGWQLDKAELRAALAAIRPYRLGPDNEPVEALFVRIGKEVDRQDQAHDVEDVEDTEDPDVWRPDPVLLAALLSEGIAILERSGDQKWDFIYDGILSQAGEEKVVLFAQPIETVTALARFLHRKTGTPPALIIGNQAEEAREAQIREFWRHDGPQFLVSSRAGGEGLNLQVARRLVHVDVPWNPMELEQRVGRVHRFGSRRKIIVDTVVALDSREVDMYRVAREKLYEIVSTLVPEDRFEGLFTRVMSLVPPEDLQAVLGERPLSPLTGDEKGRIAELITRGYRDWSEFHQRYSDQQIRDLDPGQAGWDDLGAFVQEYCGAQTVEGFTQLHFTFQDGEIRESSRAADVFRLGDGRFYACGDFAGMPVSGPDDTAAQLLGPNLDVVATALRAAAFPSQTAGAAHVRWPEGSPLPAGISAAPFGVWIAARQSLDLNTRTELRSSLHVFAITADGATLPLEGDDKGALIRSLQAGTIRREPADAPELVTRFAESEMQWVAALRQPSDSDRANRIAHAVTPLLAAIVS